MSASLGDVLLLARALLRKQKWQRRQCAADIVSVALCADAFRMQTRKAHPDWGDGSISSAALRQPLAPMPAQLTPAMIDCLRIALDAVQTAYPAAQETRTVAARSSPNRQAGLPIAP